MMEERERTRKRGKYTGRDVLFLTSIGFAPRLLSICSDTKQSGSPIAKTIDEADG